MRIRILIFATLILTSVAGPVVAQPGINTKSFAVDCRPLRGDTQRGIGKTRQLNSGFTLVLSDAAHAYYNAPASPGLRYWVVPGDIAHLNPTHKPVAAFTAKQQGVQVYGRMRPLEIYTIFITHGDGKAKNSAARTVIKGRRCGPYIELALFRTRSGTCIRIQPRNGGAARALSPANITQSEPSTLAAHRVTFRYG